VVVEAGPEILLDISGGGLVRNVILMIGDGMGVGQLTAAEIENGDDSLVITSLPYMSMVTTHSSSGYVTDSAAAATALATGFKARNGVISLDADWEELRTVVEAAEELGLSTGLVTNTRVAHATPAGFMAHVSSRDNEAEIARQALDSGVDVLMGGGSFYFNRLSPEDAGYLVVESTEELMAATSGKVLGLFNTGYMSYESVRDPEKEPSLAQMTGKALELLGSNPDGFFLMVEGGRIDHASHDNDYENAVSETLSFDASVLEALVYASGRDDTLVIVTADHVTGGLSIIGGYESSGTVLYEWIDDYHTGNMVPVYAYGPRSVEVIGFKDNTDIGEFLFSVIE
jgi:alkaline phosphatase